jgi:hypothetical protein
MFRKLIAKAEAANLRSATAQGRLSCPECGQKPASRPLRGEGTLLCAACGTRASLAEWAATAAEGGYVGNPDQPPANTRITRHTDAAGNMVWDIPASGKSGGLLFFAIFWCGITGVVTAGIAFGKSSEDSGGQPPVIFLILFFAIFWAVGLGLLYAALRNMFARTRVTASPDALTLRRELFGRAKEKSVAVAELKSISQVEFYQKNYQPVRGVEIRGTRGKLRFGSILTEEEKAWLVADLRRAAMPAAVPAPTAAARPQPAGPSSTRQAYFSISLPRSTKHLWPLAIMLALIGGVFLFIGIRFLGGDHFTTDQEDPVIIRVVVGFFAALDGIFRFVWLLAATAMLSGGLVLGVRLFRARGTEQRLEGNDSEIAIRTYRLGRVLKERVFPRAEVTDIRSSVSGKSNTTTMKRVELIVGTRAEPLARWIEGEKADALVEGARRAMF